MKNIEKSKLSATGLLFWGFALIVVIVTSAFLIGYQQFYKVSYEVSAVGQMRAARIVDQALKGYFQSLRILTENAVLQDSFQISNSQDEDQLRFQTWRPNQAIQRIQTEAIKTVLTGPKSSFTANTTITKDIYAWQLFKGLPAFDQTNRPIAKDRRLVARSILKAFPDIHYVFEMNANGDLVFLEPYETQKNVTSFNYSFRDYLTLAKQSKRTAVSEGYISHDQNRTQIITVATPIFDATNEIKKVFAASVSASVLRDRVFQTIKSNMDVNDGTRFFLVDRHGHVVASSTGENTYFPAEGATSDINDRGNIRDLGIFENVRWEEDTLEVGNIWQRATKSWVNGSLRRDYSKKYKNFNGELVSGVFYPISILDETDRKWGILIETPFEQIVGPQKSLSMVFIISACSIILTLLFIGFLIYRRVNLSTRILEANEERFRKIVAQVAHDVRSPIMALDILGKTIPSSTESQRDLLTSTIHRLEQITEDLTRTINPRNTSASQQDFNPDSVAPGIVSIDKLVGKIADEKRLEWSTTNTDYSLKIDIQPKEIFLVQGETGIWARTISNILNNSFEARIARQRLDIEVSIIKTDRYIRLKIKDNGRGIPSGIMSRIAKRGFTFGKANGSGLGLSAAREFIEGLGGELNINSSLTAGTEVEISIPQLFVGHPIPIEQP